MTKQQKITLSASRDIPFNKLMLSQSNVRHVKAGVSIEELAEDIARRTLLSSITVRPVLDESGAETGMYTIPAGGRRFRALELLVKQKRMNKTALVPCIVRTDGLAEEAEVIRAEGWKWVEVDTEFAYGHTFGMRRVHGEAVPMSDEEAASYQALKAEYDALEAEHAEADELLDEVDTRLGEIEEAMEALEARPIRYEADDLVLAGAFVSIDSSGRLRVERGYVRPEDEPVEEVEDTGDVAPEAAPVEDSDNTVASASDEEEEDHGLKPLSDRIFMELTAHRTLALRNALAQDPQVALLAALHAMVLRLFYGYAVDSCVEIEPRNAGFGSQVPGLGDTAYAQAIDQRHQTWARNLPKAPEDLWEALTEFDSCSREALFAHCVAMSANAVHDPYQRRPRAIAHADVLAGTVGLDMAKEGWTATGDSYLGRVTKARILEAVREAKGEDAADRIAGLKKAEMVTAAEDLLVGTGWLPDPLRTPPLPEEDAPEIELVDHADTADEEPSNDDPDSGEAQSAEDGGEPAIGDSEPSGEDDPVAGDAFARTAAE
jgi:ParB family chromosome partitioning protein